MTAQEDVALAARPLPDAAPQPYRRSAGALWTGRMRSIRPAWVSDGLVRGLRWGLVATWVFTFGYQCVFLGGIPWLRSDLLVWIVALLLASSVGKRSIFTVVIDFLPFAAVLVAYDYLQGISDTMGMLTWWHPQADVDRFLFAGTEPTVWLQEHLKHPDARWYDVAVALCYFSFFFLPYVAAGAMWFRSRTDFYRWSLRFVGLSFTGFTFFTLIPAAPPWAAARCSAAEIANHPNGPACMYTGDPRPGGLLGPFTSHLAGANPWVERVATRGFADLHLRFAGEWIKTGQIDFDTVAAVPSLHLGGTVLFVIFMWHRLSRWWRPLLVAYPLLMTFSLVYSGEHYLVDCVAGAMAAFGVHYAAGRVERWRKRGRGPDTLDSPPGTSQESPCPPVRPQPETTPSST
ncbi:MAG: phosphatase PAP2 family protein [Actinomycetota bacterium]|nr:phosphatase PAP2 family protein [Actinomycetota bacterium]